MKQVDSLHYQFTAYTSKERFSSFWHQVNEVLKFQPKTVLEIGPGPGIVTNILRSQGVKVTTVDFADDVGADVIASVLDLPFSEKSFDVIVCCQVLEHIEFSTFSRALAEIHRVSTHGAVISLPQVSKYWPFFIYVPKVGAIRFGLNMHILPQKHIFDGEHYWEIGKKNFPLRKILTLIRNRFSQVYHFRNWDNPYHHFFICRIE